MAVMCYDYTVQINGCDLIEEGDEFFWSDWHLTIGERIFDSEEQAREFIKSVTPQMLVDWEKQSKCNSIEIIVYKDEVLEGGNYDDFSIVGSAEWAGTTLNGVWWHDERIA